MAIHVAAIATALWIGQRRAGWRGVARRRRPARRGDPRLRPAAADPAVEPVPAAARLARRAARHVVGAVRRLADARAAGRRRLAVRPDPRALPRAVRRADDRVARLRDVAAAALATRRAPPMARPQRRRRRGDRGRAVGAAARRPADQRSGQHRARCSTTSATRPSRCSASPTASAWPSATSTCGPGSPGSPATSRAPGASCRRRTTWRGALMLGVLAGRGDRRVAPRTGGAAPAARRDRRGAGARTARR